MLALGSSARSITSARTLGPQGFVDCISNRNHSQLNDTVRRPSAMLEQPYSADVERRAKPKTCYQFGALDKGGTLNIEKERKILPLGHHIARRPS